MIIQHKNNNVTIGELNLGSKTINDVKTYTIDTDEKIDDYYVNNINTGLITNKLNYYEFKNSNKESLSLRVNNHKNISNSKIVQTQPKCNNYTNIYHFGSEGKILNYNINNKHNPDFKLEKSDSSLINPELSGIDKIGNNVYIVNDSEENYNIKTNITTNWNNKTVRLGEIIIHY